ncbi:MAG: Fic family protein [Gammaproteobacteria bacterium]
MPNLLGYSHLIARYGLRTLPLTEEARLASEIRGRESRQQGGLRLQLFEPKYRPDDTLVGHLQFALRYEGVNLQVLARLFAQTGERELLEWIQQSPESRYARVACFLYEWLTGNQLPIEQPVSARASYVWAVDNALQLALPEGPREPRFRVRNNLPGTWAYCPLVRITPYLQEMLARDLRQLTATTLARYDEDLLRRAAAYLYLKETQSSFEVEREKPSPQKAQRFADLLRQADTRTPLSEERLVTLQQAVVDPRFHEFTWRRIQNWVGKDLGYRKQVDFVPPRPADVPDLMNGLLALATEYEAMGAGSIVMSPDPVLMAAAIAFGFVFIHPFEDGNGRIHRYLIHDVLAKAGFTPRGLVLPVSAVILANLDDYIATLEQFSRPLNLLTEFDPNQPQVPALGNDAVYFRYPDLTAQAEFLYKALHRTVTEDLEREINFLLGFDQARHALNALLDWPGHSLELFIRVVHDNGGKLSANKRKSHFEWMRDEEIQTAEAIVSSAFAGVGKKDAD